MNMTSAPNIKYVSALPEKSSFYELYNTTGWNANDRTADQLSEAVTKSWHFISAYSDEKLVGCGRIISDGMPTRFYYRNDSRPSVSE